MVNSFRGHSNLPDPGETGIQRVFLDWTRPFLPAVASLLVQENEEQDEISLPGVVIALPGGRAVRRLKELLVMEAERRQLRLLPPHVITIGALPTLLLEPPLPLADPVLCRQTWVDALRSVPGDELRRIFAVVPEQRDLAAWHGLAREIQRIHEDLAGAGLRFGDVPKAWDGGYHIHDDVRWEILGRAQIAYLDGLAAVGRADPQLARLQALEAGRVGTEHSIWLAGIGELPLVTRRLLRKAAGSGTRIRALVHAPEELAHRFDAEGCVSCAGWREAIVPLQDDQISVADGPGEQAVAAVRTLAGLEGAYTADEISIGVADDEVVPYLEQYLGGQGLPVRYAAGRPLDRTGPFRLLAALADFLDGGRFQDFAALVRHPDLGHWTQEAVAHPAGKDHAWGRMYRQADCIQACDQYFSSRLPAYAHRWSPGGDRHHAVVRALTSALNGGETQVKAGEAAPGNAPKALLEGLRRKRPLADWAQAILDLLVRVYGQDKPLDRNDPAVGPVLEACERIRDAAAPYQDLPAQVNERCTASTAIRLLLTDAAGEAVPPEADGPAIEVLGWLELHMDDAPVAIVTGANEPYLPASVHGDPFLPDSLCARLGLPDNNSRLARDVYYLSAILASRKVVHVVAGRRRAEGDPLRPSRLLLAVPRRELARRVLLFYSEGGGAGTGEYGLLDAGLQGTEGGLPGPGSSTDAPAWARRFQLPPEPVIRAETPITRLRASDFATILQDPYCFALQRLVGLEPLDDSSRELDPLGFGSLAHDVLQAFGQSDQVDSAAADEIQQELDALLDAAVAERFGLASGGGAVRHGGPLPAVLVQVEQLRARLHAFARWQAEWFSAGWRVVAVEGVIREHALPPARRSGTDSAQSEDLPGAHGRLTVSLEVDQEPFTVTGRIDRIDHNAATGQWAVLDYKTGDVARTPERAHRRRSGGEWIDLQLPLYRRLLAGLPAGDGKPLVPPEQETDLRLGYILLPRDLDRTGVVFADWQESDFAAADQAARDVIRLVRKGEFHYDPTKVASPFNPLVGLLGQGHLAAIVGDDTEGESGEGEGGAE